MSKPNEYEKLQTKRTELEAQSLSLKEEQKNLEDRVMILEEKIAIEELESNNKVAREAITQLETKLNGLEAKLHGASPMLKTPEVAKEPEPETANVQEEALEAAGPAPEEFEEDVVTVTAIEEESLVENQEGLGENLKAQQEKKKRKFF